MNNHQKSWQRLAAAARAHRVEHDETAPYGFAARITTRALVTPTTTSLSLMEKFALRGLIAACTMGVAATAFGFAGTGNDDAELVAGDVVGEILDRS